MKVVDKDRIRKVLKETVLALCQTGMEFTTVLTVEGLLGITLDQKEVILVNINEVVRPDLPKDLSISKTSCEKRKADVVNNNTVHSFNGQSNISSDYHNKRIKSTSAYSDKLQEIIVNNGQDSGCTVSVGTLRMPIIPPEHRWNDSSRERKKSTGYFAERHKEASNLHHNDTMKKTDQTHLNPLFFHPHFFPISHIKTENDTNKCSMYDMNENDIRAGNELGKDVYNSYSNILGSNEKLQMSSKDFSQELGVSQKKRTSFSNNMVLNEMKHNRPMSTEKSPNMFNNSQFTINHPKPIGSFVDQNVLSPKNSIAVGGTGVLQPLDVTKSSTNGANQPLPIFTTPKKENSSPSSLKATDYLSPGSNSLKTENKSSPSNVGSLGRGGKEFRRFRCTLCPASSSRKFNLQRHMKSHHPGCGEQYILDLNPKERGCSKSGDKTSPLGPGFLYSDSMNDDLSNNSDGVMDLSSNPNYGESDDSFVVNNNGSENIKSESPICELKTEAVTSEALKPTGGKPGKTRKGLDHVLFSKFGCYTDMYNGKDTKFNFDIRNEVKQECSSPVKEDSPVFDDNKSEPGDSLVAGITSKVTTDVLHVECPQNSSGASIEVESRTSSDQTDVTEVDEKVANTGANDEHFSDDTEEMDGLDEEQMMKEPEEAENSPKQNGDIEEVNHHMETTSNNTDVFEKNNTQITKPVVSDGYSVSKEVCIEDGEGTFDENS